jgi:hypothetical protein
MVNDGTIDRAVTAVFAFRKEQIVGDNADKFGGDLIKLNMEALRQRYNEKPMPFTYKHREHDDADPILAQCKAMHCLTYQCAEGNVPETPLYKLLAEVEEYLNQRVCKKYRVKRYSNIKAYHPLPWDFDD